MIRKGDKEMQVRYHGSRVITAVYKGAKLVWEAVCSCFGSGVWTSCKGWSDTDGWKEL